MGRAPQCTESATPGHLEFEQHEGIVIETDPQHFVCAARHFEICWVLVLQEMPGIASNSDVLCAIEQHQRRRNDPSCPVDGPRSGTTESNRFA